MTEAVEGTLLWEPSEEFQENANIESKEDKSGSTQPEAPTPCGPRDRESESHAEGCVESCDDSKAHKHLSCEGSI